MSGEEFAMNDDENTKTLEEYCLKVQDDKRKIREIMENPQVARDD